MGFFNRFKNKIERSVGEGAGRTASVTSTEAKPEAVVESKEKKAAPEIALVPTTLAHRILSHAYVTEKTATLTAGRTYTFVVPLSATKLQVKRAVGEAYGVTPESVRMIRRAGKFVRFGNRTGQRKDWKKALVTVPEGKTLPIYE